VQPHVEDRKRAIPFFLGDVGAGHFPPIHDIGRPGAEYPEAFFLLDLNCCILIQPNTEQPGVLRHRAEQPADAASLGKVLVDNHVLEVS
jgi:hypothetical protein